MQDEAEAIIKEVREDDAAQDPDAAKRKIIDAFGEINVTVEQLGEYLGHPVGECSAKEITDLRGFYGAIRDEETTWAAIMESRRETGSAPKQPAGATKGAKDLQQAGSATGTSTSAKKEEAKPAQQRQESRTASATAAAMFTVVDALAMVARGQYDEARDLARSFNDADKKKVETAIKARGGPAAEPERGTPPAEEEGSSDEPLPAQRTSDVDLTDVLNAIKGAKDLPDLDAAGTLIEELPPEDQVTASSKWNVRKGELAKPAGPATAARRAARGTLE